MLFITIWVPFNETTALWPSCKNLRDNKLQWVGRGTQKTKASKTNLDISPESKARPRATQQGCTKCKGTSLCQWSWHRKKFQRKADNEKKYNADQNEGHPKYGTSIIWKNLKSEQTVAQISNVKTIQNWTQRSGL